MVCAMLNDDEKKRTVLCVIIEPENFERMTKADPITLESILHGGALPLPRYPMDFNILIAYEADTRPVLELAKKDGNGDALLAYLERKRVFITGKDGTENTVPIRREDKGHTDA